MELLEYLGRAGVRIIPAGTNEFKCLCLFHQEHTPSMYVNPSKGQWYCQGCHKGGDLIELIMQHEGIPFLEARDKAGTQSAPRRVIPVARQDPLTYDVKLRMTNAAFQYEKELSTNVPATKYLTQVRGLSYGTIIRHHVGLCTERASDIEPPLGNSHHATLTNHVTVPDFYDGLCIYMQGRRIVPGDPKYMGLHDIPKPLYGFWRFRNEKTLYLVEGPFDWLTLLEWGLPVVSSLGSHLSPAQAALLSNKRVVLSQDADLAGDLAAQQLARTLPNTTRLRPPEPFKDWNDALVAGWNQETFRSYEGNQTVQGG